MKQEAPRQLGTSVLQGREHVRVECEHCEDGIRWTSRYGGNDPDVWPVGRCETCDGTGRVEVVCEWCGDHGATDLLEGRPYHLECAEEVLADMYRVIERAA
jgi:hypothetical protein